MRNLPDIAQYKHIEIDGSGHLDKGSFNDKYGYASVPVIFKGIAKNWGIVSQWDFGFFKDNYGTHTEKVSNSSQTRDEVFSISEFCDYSLTTSDADPYYLKTSFHIHTGLAKSYAVPEFFDCWYDKDPRKKIKLSWIYIGPENSFSSLHVDSWDTSAWNLVTKGKKIWLFYHPDQAGFLYDGHVNPFYPDHEQYPLFKHAVPLVCVQEPGEIVFTPSTWWHAVYNIEPGISLTENFINETNFKNVLSHFEEQNMLKALAAMTDIVNANMHLNQK